MQRSLKQYMMIDLTILAVIGFVLEIFCVRFSAVVFNSPPAIVMSLLIIFMAVTRWNLYGLLITPILALAVLLGGRWIEFESLRQIYDWRFALASLLGMLTAGFDVIFYKKFSTKKIINGYPIFGMIFMNFILFAIVDWVSYSIITVGTNAFSFSSIWCNLFGCFIMLVGALVFRSLGILCNMKQKFIDDKKEMELDAKDKQFRIEEVPDESLKNDSDVKE